MLTSHYTELWIPSTAQMEAIKAAAVWNCIPVPAD